MKSIKENLKLIILNNIKNLYQIELNSLEIQQTRSEFKGHFTLIVFPITKFIKKSPEIIAKELGDFIIKNNSQVIDYNIIKGFLNLTLADSFLSEFIKYNHNKKDFGTSNPKDKKIMVEYSSPNTNKPLHLGHIRNILLGFSVNKILKKAGYNVHKTQIINDRGIHICKSMLAWKMFAKGEKPNDNSQKGDHFVGKYYVLFDKEYQKQIKELVEQGIDKEQAKKEAPILLEAQKLLILWEQNDQDVWNLWKEMNSWVYQGFDQTYKRLGVDFDSIQYESQTYLLGKDLVEQGLKNNVFYKKEDSSVWCDLTSEKLDEKLVIRKDGTSVYITQDLGTAVERIQKHNIDQLIYTVGNEQDYHFKVLFSILNKLGYNSDMLKHLSYGMVDLPEGKMKSREGTVVDADDLMDEMYKTAKNISLELGKLDGFSDNQKNILFEQIGLGALKYFILKIEPKKRILFNPKESVDFQGNTAPFIQYAHARINSLIKKSELEISNIDFNAEFNEYEHRIITHLDSFNEVIEKSAKELNPALIANYVYELVKLYNSFYQNNNILKEKNQNVKNQRLAISNIVKNVINESLNLLGIDSPERM